MPNPTVVVSVPQRPAIQASVAPLPRVVVSAQAASGGGDLPATVGTTGEPISGGDFVSVGADGLLYRADASNPARTAAGFVRQAVGAGAQVSVYTGGRLAALSGLVPGTAYYLSGTNAGKPAVAPSGAFVQRVGVASAVDVLLVAIEPPILTP